MPYCITLRSRTDAGIIGWYDGSNSRWSTDHNRRKVFDKKRDARPVCHELRSLCPRNAEVINIEAAQNDPSLELAILCWHLLTKNADYQWARAALVANKLRAMKLQTGQPARKGNKRGPAYAYNVKALRNAEIEFARDGEEAYVRFVSQSQHRGTAKQRTAAEK